MHVLILGGTRFAGRAVVDAALDRGDTVTLFNRGQTNPGLYPQVETIIGDRTGDLSALSARHWDAVVDVAAYDPEVVRRSVRALADAADRYVFVSTVSVYADHGVRQVEGAAVIPLEAGIAPDDLYGARKAVAEAIVSEAFGDRSLIARAGLIVGPHDPTDRFAYWPRRIARGGRILAPGDPADPMQFIDVRDLGGWIIEGARRGLRGVFNLTGEPVPFGRLLEECVAATGSRDADLQWVPTARLLAAGVDPWMGVPLWLAAPGWEAANDVDVSRALAAGLRLRPLAETIRDTLAWDQARGGPAPGTEGLSAGAEERLLRRLAGPS
ncbi:MAG TPA: NAD-dependent epimerase/dehydratase family protein [Streptosporangiaceae bacterium]|jgi:2'-hydroxyisoflavone reductase